MKVVEAQGKKAAERLLEARIAELEQHQTIDVERPHRRLGRQSGRRTPAPRSSARA